MCVSLILRPPVDLDRSSTASPPPYLSTEASMVQHELPLRNAQRYPLGLRGTSAAGEFTTAQVGDTTSSTDACVPEPALPFVHPPQTASITDPATWSDAVSVTESTGPTFLRESHDLDVGTRTSRYARDGGVRLAGGPLDGSDDDDTTTATLPPPYERY